MLYTERFICPAEKRGARGDRKLFIFLSLSQCENIVTYPVSEAEQEPDTSP